MLQCFSREKRRVLEETTQLISYKRKEMHVMRKRGGNLLLSSIVTVQKFILSPEDSGAVEQ